MTAILILLLLILLNGVFAMAEIAMVSARRSRLEASAKKGDKTAKKALELSANPGKFLSTVQIGITLIGILTGIYSGQQLEDDLDSYLAGFEALRPYSETLAISFIVITLTFFSLVLGELVPKRIGLSKPEIISRLLSYPLYLVSVIAAPFIWLLTFTSDMILRLLRIKKDKNSHITEEEIKAIIREATATGAVQEIEQDIVENVFYLGDRKIQGLMTLKEKIVWLNTNDAPETIKSKMISAAYRSFPVCRNVPENIAGVIHLKEILNSLLESGTFEIEKHLKTPLFLDEKTTAYDALQRFRKSKQHFALVVDEFKKVQGILTMNDLVDALVGDFAQQLHEKKEIIPRENGTFLVDGSLPMQEFIRYFEIEITADDAASQINTVAALAFHFKKKSLHTGYEFIWKNLSIEIIDMDGRRIDKVLVKKINKV